VALTKTPVDKVVEGELDVPRQMRPVASPRYKRTPSPVVALTMVLAGLLLATAAAGSTRQISLYSTAGERFTGVLPDDKPAYRDVRLAAGDALKLWEVPHGKPYADNVGFGITISERQLARWKPFWDGLGDRCAGAQGATSAGAGFYVAYTNVLRRDPNAFASLGHVVFYQQSDDQWQAFCRYNTKGYPTFWVFDGCHGCGSTYQSHTWAAFVAPSTGVYRILLGGYPGGYQLGMAIERLRKGIVPKARSSFDQSQIAHDKVFPYTGSRWVAAVKSHAKWFLSRSFFPKFESRDDDPIAKLRKALSSR
jgi:hypothetical protein